ncbi:MAG: hypothetical protein AB1Z57_06440 [Acidimicrobiia bacterium]
MLAKRALNVASAILALLIMAFLVWDASGAAFTAQTDETGSVTAAAVALSDDDAISTDLTLPAVLVPGDTYEQCVTVTYTGTAVGADLTGIRLYGPGSTDALAQYLLLSVGEGADCTAAEAAATNVYDATALDSLPTDFAGGAGSWVPAASGETRAYFVSVQLDANTPDAQQGATASFTLTWEVQTS